MAERLNAINVGYRPLNPADDVAGLAGQRQAVSEFQAASADMARRADAANAAAMLALRVREQHDRTQLAMMEAAQRREQANQQMQLSRMQLAEKAASDRIRLDQSQQQINMDAATLPVELRRMSLQNEAAEIENQYAAEGMALSNQSLANNNALKRQELKDAVLKGQEATKIETEVAKMQNWVDNGGAIENYKSSFNPVYNENKAELDRQRRLIAATSANRANANTANAMELQVDALPVAVQDAFDIGTKFRTQSGGINDDGMLALKRETEFRALEPSDAEISRIVDSAKAGGPLGEVVNGSYVIKQAGLDEIRAARIAGEIPKFSDPGIEGGKGLSYEQFMAEAMIQMKNALGDDAPQDENELRSMALERFGQSVTGLDQGGEQMSKSTVPLYIYDPNLGRNIELVSIDANKDWALSDEERETYESRLAGEDRTLARRKRAATLGSDGDKVELDPKDAPGILDDTTDLEYSDMPPYFKEKWDRDEVEDGFLFNKGTINKRWKRMGIKDKDRKEYTTLAMEHAGNSLSDSNGLDPKKALTVDVFQAYKKHEGLDDARETLASQLAFDSAVTNWAQSDQVTRNKTYDQFDRPRTDKEIRQQEGDFHYPREASEIITSELYKSPSVQEALAKPVEDWKDGDVILIPVVHERALDFGKPNTQGSGWFGTSFFGEAHWGEGHVPIYSKAQEKNRKKMHRVVLSREIHDFGKLAKALRKMAEVGPELDKLNSYIGR